MIKSVTSIAVATTFAFLAMPAVAQERDGAEAFNGPSVTLIAGVDVNTKRLPKDSTGVLYGGQIGYDVRRGDVVFGAEGEITGSTSDKCTTLTGTAHVSTNTYCLKNGRDLYVGGRLGVVVGGSTLLYGKVGYTNARVPDVASYSATPNFNFSRSGNLDGFRLGAGVEQAISSRVSLKAEYRYSRYGQVYDRHQAVVGVGFHF